MALGWGAAYLKELMNLFVTKIMLSILTLWNPNHECKTIYKQPMYYCTQEDLEAATKRQDDPGSGDFLDACEAQEMVQMRECI